MKVQLVELADAVHQGGDVRAETRLHVLQRAGGVLEHVMEQRGLDRAGVQAQIGENLRHGDGVGDVGVAAETLLPGVGLGAELVRVDDAAELLGRQVALERADQLPELIAPPDRG